MRKAGKRYFWAVAIGNTNKGHTTIGFVFDTKDGKYPSRRSITEWASDAHNMTAIVIMNIVELSESDYNDFIAV